jgi:hypothetical protein
VLKVIGETNSDLRRALEKVPVMGSEVLAGDFQTRLGSVGIRSLGQPVTLISKLEATV